MAGLDPVVGSEQGGRRPVLIVQNDRGNRYSPTVIAVPLTGSERKPALPTHVYLPAGTAGLRKPSVVLCEQVRTLEKSRLSLNNTKEGAHQSPPRLPVPEPSLTRSLCVLQIHFSGCFCIFSEVMVSGQV